MRIDTTGIAPVGPDKYIGFCPMLRTASLDSLGIALYASPGGRELNHTLPEQCYPIREPIPGANLFLPPSAMACLDQGPNS